MEDIAEVWTFVFDTWVWDDSTQDMAANHVGASYGANYNWYIWTIGFVCKAQPPENYCDQKCKTVPKKN